MNLYNICEITLFIVLILALVFHRIEILSIRVNLDDIIKEYKEDKREKNPRTLSQYDDFIYNNKRYCVAFTNNLGIIPDSDETCHKVITYEELSNDNNFKIVYRN